MEFPDWVLEARVEDRTAALGLGSPADYVDLVVSAGQAAELDLLLESLRVGETRFFRHAGHVAALRDAVIPELRKRRPGSRIRAWSAGCASGEEAYTLAVLLRELMPGSRFKIDVLGTDLSARAIAAARRAEYPAGALDQVPEDWRRRAFAPVPGAPEDAAGRPGRYRAVADIARCVTFQRRNLLAGPYPEDVDIIWCRNVFIYFTEEARQKVVSRLVGSLSRDGVFFVGYSETLRDCRQVEPIRAGSAVFYRRSRASERKPRTPLLLPPSSVEHAKSLPPHPFRKEVVVELCGRYDSGARMAAELRAVMAGSPERVVVEMDGAEFLGDAVAAVLRRAQSAAQATDVDMLLLASRPGIRRWLARHGIAHGVAAAKRRARPTDEGDEGVES